MSEKIKLNRIVISVKDIMSITGHNYNNCYRELQTIKDSLGKQKHQLLTFYDYSEYTGIKIEDIKTTLGL